MVSLLHRQYPVCLFLPWKFLLGNYFYFGAGFKVTCKVNYNDAARKTEIIIVRKLGQMQQYNPSIKE